ncbi:conjugal transfer protein TrbI, partial [Mesorhizobium sp. B292B1B]|nr:conjugal transfer protein TrbI [Mesorhizobium sp. B292B1B]
MIQRSPELEALAGADDPAVGDASVRRKQLAGRLVLMLFGLFAAYFVLAGRRPAQRSVVADDEQFSTMGFRPPSFMREHDQPAKPAAPEVIQLPPPPPPP